MHQKVFEELFEGYLQNTLSEVEKQQLMEIIRNGMHDDFIKEKINMLLQENDEVELLDTQKGDHILKYIISSPSPKVVPIRKKSSKKVIRIALSIAAAIVVLFAIRSAFFYNVTPNPIKTATTEPSEEVNPVLAFSGKQLIHLPD
jgi:hypothetical protein